MSETRDIIEECRRINIQRNERMLKDIIQDFPEVEEALQEGFAKIQKTFSEMKVYLSNRKMIVHDGIYVYKTKSPLGFSVEVNDNLGFEYKIAETDLYIFIVRGSEYSTTIEKFYKDTGERVSNSKRYRKISEDKKGKYINLDKNTKYYL